MTTIMRLRPRLEPEEYVALQPRLPTAKQEPKMEAPSQDH